MELARAGWVETVPVQTRCWSVPVHCLPERFALEVIAGYLLDVDGSTVRWLENEVVHA